MGNRKHPGYGLVSIPFPIPQDQYSHIVEMLEAIEICDVLCSDCCVVQGESTATLFLPTSDKQISRILTRGNIDKQAACEMKIVDSSFCVSMEEYIIPKTETIYMLNRMCEAAEAMGDPLKLGTIIRCIEPSTAEQVVLSFF